MSTVKIDGRDLPFNPGQTIIQVARNHGIDIPFYCWHPRLSVAASCRMCLVEVEKAPKLLPACEVQCREGMVVKTTTEGVKKSRQAIMEFQLLNHPIDCPICDQAGECKLQNYYMEHDLAASRFDETKVVKRKHVELGPLVMMDEERCINCTRCVRFMEEVAQNPQLGQFDRGDRAHIGTFPGQPLDDPYSLNTVEICPVGALTSRDFRFKVRSWFLKSASSVCNHCAGGCSITIDHYENEIKRYRARDNEETNKGWLCDVGRLSYKQIHDPDTQITVPHRRQADGQLRPIAWDQLEAQLKELLGPIASQPEPKLGLSVSAQLTCEGITAFLELAEAGLPVDSFALFGRPDGLKDRMLRKADKNPNRAGAELAFEAYSVYDEGLQLKKVLERAELDALIMVGTDHPEFDESWKAAFLASKVIAFSSNWNAAAQAAELVIPLTSFAEQDGSFVNNRGLMQRIHRALKPINGRPNEIQAAAMIAKVWGFGSTWELRRWSDAFQRLADRAHFPDHFKPSALGEWGTYLDSLSDLKSSCANRRLEPETVLAVKE